MFFIILGKKLFQPAKMRKFVGDQMELWILLPYIEDNIPQSRGT